MLLSSKMWQELWHLPSSAMRWDPTDFEPRIIQLLSRPNNNSPLARMRFCARKCYIQLIDTTDHYIYACKETKKQNLSMFQTSQWIPKELQKSTDTAPVSWSKLKCRKTINHTKVCTAPGFWTLMALTTWNTSTTPSVLHLSMVVATPQNIADLLTVLLQTEKRMLLVEQWCKFRRFQPYLYYSCERHTSHVFVQGVCTLHVCIHTSIIWKWAGNYY